MKSEQKGTTMMEAMAVLCIITVLGISAISLIGNLFTMFKQSMVASELADVHKGVSDRYRAFGNYADLPTSYTATWWRNEKIIPNQMIFNDGIFHRLGGEVKIEVCSGSSCICNPKNECFTITFKKITNKSCFDLGMIDWTSRHSSSLVKLQIDETSQFFRMPNDTMSRAAYINNKNSFPPKPNILAEYCSKDNYDDNHTMIWTFR